MSQTTQYDSSEFIFDNAMRKEWSSNLAIFVHRPRTFVLSLWDSCLSERLEKLFELYTKMTTQQAPAKKSANRKIQP
jgi:hypothetical protein